MVTEFRFPDIAEGITEGEIVEWIVKEGDVVKEHDILGKIETDKAIAEMPSPAAGTILKIHHKKGDTVKVGEILVTIGKPGEIVAPAAPPVEKKPELIKPGMKPAGVVGYLEEAPEVEEEKIPPKPPEAPLAKEALATPATRRIAKEMGVDLSQITGTGLEGRVTEEDVRKFTEQQGITKGAENIKIVKKYDMFGYVDRIPLKGVRKATAKRMVESKQHIPHVAHMDEADVTELARIREHEKEGAAKQGIKLTYLPFVVKALIAGFRKYPMMCASVDEEHEEIVVKKYYNISIAVDIEEGLVVPVVKGADQKSILELAKEIEELADKARDRTVDLQDLRGGVFTITNVGSIGGIFSTPVINYPESAILATGKIYEKPVVINGKVEIRKVMPLSLVFDHRVVDGAYAARFMNEVIMRLQDPDKLLLERD